MKTTVVLSLLASFCVASLCQGQRAIQITFDGPPIQPPRTAYSVTNYSESGMVFRPIPHPPPGISTFGRVGSPPVSFLPDDGSTYLDAALGDSLMFNSASGSVFTLFSVDLAEYSTVVPNAVTVRFVGYRHDGTIVTNEFTTDGIIDGTGPLVDFQTFYFDQSFTNLDRVEIPISGWSLDNLVVSAPLPHPIFTGNHIVAWGDNSYGQTNVPPAATNVQAVAAGLGFSLALMTNGTVLEWGSSGLRVPTGLSNVVAISAGYGQSLALKSDGSLFAWGTGPLTNAPAGLTNVVAIACGQDHNLAHKNDGTVYAWGSSYSGQTNIPADLQNVVAIAAGTSSSLAMRQDGSTWLSGRFTNQFNTFSSNVVAAAIVSGGEQGIAVRRDGTGYGWGFPNGTNVVVISNVTAVASVSPYNQAGAVWALLRCGTLTGLASGANLASYLGQTNVWMNLTNVVAIASGYTHHLAIIGDGLPKLVEPMASAGISNGQFIVVQPTSLGRSYRLEYKNSLVEDWQMFPPVPGNCSTQVLADPCPMLSQRFYRVHVGQ